MLKQAALELQKRDSKRMDLLVRTHDVINGRVEDHHETDPARDLYDESELVPVQAGFPYVNGYAPLTKEYEDTPRPGVEEYRSAMLEDMLDALEFERLPEDVTWLVSAKCRLKNGEWYETDAVKGMEHHHKHVAKDGASVKDDLRPAAGRRATCIYFFVPRPQDEEMGEGTA